MLTVDPGFSVTAVYGQYISASKKSNTLYYMLYKSTHPKHSSALYSQGVLIDLNDFGVLQDFFELRAYGGQSVGHEQRSGQHSPNGHLHLALIDCQTKIADEELQKKTYNHTRN